MFQSPCRTEGKRNTRNIDGQLKDVESGSVSPTNLNDLMDVLPNIDVSDIMEIPNIFECDDQTLPCDHTSRFRTATGWCNNLNIPNFGKSFRAQARLLRPSYEDGEGLECSILQFGVLLLSENIGIRELC